MLNDLEAYMELLEMEHLLLLLDGLAMGLKKLEQDDH